MEQKYYEAYNDRYQQIHAQNLQWFYDNPSQIVTDTIQKYHITQTDKILELGCGEGRDAFALLTAGYDLLATDVAEAAIAYCRKKHPEFTDRFQVWIVWQGRCRRSLILSLRWRWCTCWFRMWTGMHSTGLSATIYPVAAWH